MLVLFRFKNFGPFREEVTLDMRAVKAYKEHQYNLISETSENSFLKVVSIFGANASGKSNFIDAYSMLNKDIKDMYKLVFLGEGNDRTQVEEYIKEKKLFENILFVVDPQLHTQL